MFASEIFPKSPHELGSSKPLFRNPKAIKVGVGLVKAEDPFELKLTVPLTGIRPGDPAYCQMLCRRNTPPESPGALPGRDF